MTKCTGFTLVSFFIFHPAHPPEHALEKASAETREEEKEHGHTAAGGLVELLFPWKWRVTAKPIINSEVLTPVCWRYLTFIDE